MSREAYFRYLEETAAIVGPLIGRLLVPYKEKYPAVYDDLMLFAGTRLDRPLQKPSLFRLAFEICGGTQWERFALIAAAFELLNISSYQANASFDNKLGTLTDNQKDAQFICSMISRELSATAIQECITLPETIRGELMQSLSHINEQIYLAQYRDLFVLTLKRRREYEADCERYLAVYEERCRLGSGVFNSEICRWGGVLAGGNDMAIGAMKAFGDEFGVALQIANDIGDYAPAGADHVVTRDYQDQHSDLRNGRLTFMLHRLLVNAAPATVEFVERLLANKGAAASDLAKVSRLCVTEGAFREARQLASMHVSQATQQIEPFRGTSEHELLEAMTSIALHNKYFVALKDTEKPQ